MNLWDFIWKKKYFFLPNLKRLSGNYLSTLEDLAFQASYKVRSFMCIWLVVGIMHHFTSWRVFSSRRHSSLKVILITLHGIFSLSNTSKERIDKISEYCLLVMWLFKLTQFFGLFKIRVLRFLVIRVKQIK